MMSGGQETHRKPTLWKMFDCVAVDREQRIENRETEKLFGIHQILGSGFCNLKNILLISLWTSVEQGDPNAYVFFYVVKCNTTNEEI